MIPELSLCSVENPIPAFKADGVGVELHATKTNYA